MTQTELNEKLKEILYNTNIKVISKIKDGKDISILTLGLNTDVNGRIKIGDEKLHIDFLLPYEKNDIWSNWHSIINALEDLGFNMIGIKQTKYNLVEEATFKYGSSNKVSLPELKGFWDTHKTIFDYMAYDKINKTEKERLSDNLKIYLQDFDTYQRARFIPELIMRFGVRGLLTNAILEGVTTAFDVFDALFNNADDWIYYNDDSRLKMIMKELVEFKIENASMIRSRNYLPDVIVIDYQLFKKFNQNIKLVENSARKSFIMLLQNELEPKFLKIFLKEQRLPSINSTSDFYDIIDYFIRFYPFEIDKETFDILFEEIFPLRNRNFRMLVNEFETYLAGTSGGQIIYNSVKNHNYLIDKIKELSENEIYVFTNEYLKACLENKVVETPLLISTLNKLMKGLNPYDFVTRTNGNIIKFGDEAFLKQFDTEEIIEYLVAIDEDLILKLPSFKKLLLI